ncbi:MAG: metal ABC transporter ATP-binding protein [bacterium]
MSSLLNAHDITVKYGGHLVVDHVSFELNRGEVMAIVGPNGAGKSTLMKAVLGLIPCEGRVHWHEDVRIGYVPQHLNFDRDFPITVEELFALKITTKHVQRETKRLLEEVHAGHLAGKLLGSLSGGEMQRVFIAYALANDPEILFFDEPSSGIDVTGEETIYALIHELSEAKKLTIVLISHDLDIVYEHATSVLCLNRRMVCHGVPRVALSASNIDKLYGKHTGVYGHEHSHHDV